MIADFEMEIKIKISWSLFWRSPDLKHLETNIFHFYYVYCSPSCSWSNHTTVFGTAGFFIITTKMICKLQHRTHAKCTLMLSLHNRHYFLISDKGFLSRKNIIDLEIFEPIYFTVYRCFDLFCILCIWYDNNCMYWMVREPMVNNQTIKRIKSQKRIYRKSF